MYDKIIPFLQTLSFSVQTAFLIQKKFTPNVYIVLYGHNSYMLENLFWNT